MDSHRPPCWGDVHSSRLGVPCFRALWPVCLPPHCSLSSSLLADRACRALLVVAEQNGNHLRECWTDVLRCVSRFELLQQLTAGVPTDALLFAMPDKVSGTAADKLKRRILRGRGREEGAEGGLANDSFSSINDMGLHASELGFLPGWLPGWAAAWLLGICQDGQAWAQLEGKCSSACPHMQPACMEAA